MRILISDEARTGETDIGETVGSQLVDPDRKNGLKTGDFGTYGFGISLENLHKLKVPRTV